MIYIAFYKSPIGYIRIEVTDEMVFSIQFVDEEIVDFNDNEQHPILRNTVNQLKEYFNGERKEFTLPLRFSGTEFQKNVLDQVSNIPFGETTSYKSIAKKVGNEKAVRAVGSTNRNNKLLIVIPCHRVIGSNQKLTGYAGGVWRKEWLLQYENYLLKKDMRGIFGKDILPVWR